MSCRSGVGVLRSTDGADAISDLEKAEIPNNHFASVCTADNGIFPQFDRLVADNVELSNIEFTPASVTRAINLHLSLRPHCLNYFQVSCVLVRSQLIGAVP